MKSKGKSITVGELIGLLSEVNPKYSVYVLSMEDMSMWENMYGFKIDIEEVTVREALNDVAIIPNYGKLGGQ